MYAIIAKRSLLMTALFAALVIAAGCSRAGAEPALPHNAGIQSWFENGAGGRYVVPVISGRAGDVTGAMQGVVLTDSDCTPDAQGLSHCHNFIGLENGTRIQIQNNHKMSLHRCLRPGETVLVQPMHDSWVTVQVRS